MRRGAALNVQLAHRDVSGRAGAGGEAVRLIARAERDVSMDEHISKDASERD